MNGRKNVAMTDERDAGNATALPAEYYLSADLYRRETERIFHRHWLCIGRASDLPSPGDYRELTVEGESLILQRDREGAIRGFYNVCRHRGMRLCEAGAAGRQKTIRCGYHGWTYDMSGRLVNAPNMAGVPGFDASAYPLAAVETAEWEGFLFMRFDSGGPPFESAFQTVLERFRPWQLADLVPGGQRIYDVDANWKLLFQNYSECYHCSRVHPRLNELSPFSTASNEVHEGPVLGGPMELAEGVGSMTTTGRPCGPVLAGLSAAEQRRVYYFTLFPTLFLSPHPDFVLVHRLERLAADRTRVVCEFLFPPETLADPRFDASPAIDFWDETNRQDWRVCEMSQQGISSRAYIPGPYSQLECTLAAFDRHYLSVLAD